MRVHSRWLAGSKRIWPHFLLGNHLRRGAKQLNMNDDNGEGTTVAEVAAHGMAQDSPERQS